MAVEVALLYASSVLKSTNAQFYIRVSTHLIKSTAARDYYLLTSHVKVLELAKLLKLGPQLSRVDTILDVLDITSPLWLLLWRGSAHLLRLLAVMAATHSSPFIL
jgi:hypothetical protein